MREMAALAARIREQLGELTEKVERAQLLAKRARETGDDGYWDGVALNLHGFYTGIERIFEDIARHVDGSVPTGPDWHRDLLVQMAAEMPGIRPAVLSRASRSCLDEFRGFRHLVRSVYAFKLRPQRLQELVDALRDCSAGVTCDLTRFAEFLSALGTQEI